MNVQGRFSEASDEVGSIKKPNAREISVTTEHDAALQLEKMVELAEAFAFEDKDSRETSRLGGGGFLESSGQED